MASVTGQTPSHSSQNHPPWYQPPGSSAQTTAAITPAARPK
ncbi:MAG TPA: hypothetical protein VFH68_18670 [Polyangia bacterium]|nr:hypothetical protein [Polyangia bacterium]